MEACRICGTYQSDHAVTELWVEVTETCGTCQSDHVVIDLWVEVTEKHDAYQGGRSEVESPIFVPFCRRLFEEWGALALIC